MFRLLGPVRERYQARMINALVTTGPAEVRELLDRFAVPTTSHSGANRSGADEDTGDEDTARDTDGGDTCGPHRSVSAHESLARLLGLPGTITVGDQLEEAPRLRRTTWDEGQQARHLLVSQALGRRRIAIRKRVERRYAQAFAGTRPLPGPIDMRVVMIDQGALPGDPLGPATAGGEPQRDGDQPDEPNARSAVPPDLTAILARCHERISGRYRGLFAGTLAVVRRELHWLRDDLHRQLRGLGAEGDALLALSNALSPALDRGINQAYRILGDSVDRAFARRFAQAASELSAPAFAAPHAPVELDSWFAEEGWVTRHLADARRLTLALLDIEWKALCGLADAVCGPLPHSPETAAPASANLDLDTPNTRPVPQEFQ